MHQAERNRACRHQPEQDGVMVPVWRADCWHSALRRSWYSWMALRQGDEDGRASGDGAGGFVLMVHVGDKHDGHVATLLDSGVGEPR